MLTEKEIEEIIKKPVIEDVECIALIRKFIFDKTGKDIKGINRPVGNINIKHNPNGFPSFESDFDLMLKMFWIAKAHYLEIKN